MEYTDKEYCLEVWGDMACFTRPELKVERVSYDVITPSAARAIFEAIFWKPAIHWQITKIEVLNPVKWTSVRRNEVGAVAGTKTASIYIEEKRQQKNSLLLKDVRYRIWAKMEFRSVKKRKAIYLSMNPGTMRIQRSITKCLNAERTRDNVSTSLTSAHENSRLRFDWWILKTRH